MQTKFYQFWFKMVKIGLAAWLRATFPIFIFLICAYENVFCVMIHLLGDSEEKGILRAIRNRMRLI